MVGTMPLLCQFCVSRTQRERLGGVGRSRRGEEMGGKKGRGKRGDERRQAVRSSSPAILPLPWLPQ